MNEYCSYSVRWGMSIFFQEIDDDIAFGIQSSNVPEVALFSSTGSDAYLRLFTNNYSSLGIDNLDNGNVIGTSNYQLGSLNELYLGNVTGNSNIHKVVVIRNSNLGINTPAPTAELHVTGPASNEVPLRNTKIVQIDYSSNNNASVGTALYILGDGTIGMGTTPTSGVTLSIAGGAQVDNLQISNYLTTVGIRAPGALNGSNYLVFGNNSLCNITNIVATGTVTGNSLVADTGKIESLAISRLSSTSKYVANTIDVTRTVLSNVGDIYTAPTAAVRTNIITAASAPTGGTIDFNNTNVQNIRNLSVNGTFSVDGNFTVVNTATSTTDQLRIDNDGTAPAVIINQNGANDILHLMASCNIIGVIRNTGQIALGNYGTVASNAPVPIVPNAMLSLVNPSSKAQEALYINQQSSTKNIATLVGTAGLNAITISPTGQILMGPSNMTPTARLQIVQQNNIDNSDFFKISTTGGPTNSTTCNLLWVSSDGTLHVKGNVMATNYFITNENGNNFLDFISNNLSSVDDLMSSQLITQYGTAVDPSLTFSMTSNTSNCPGMFAPNSNTLGLATSGLERVRVTSDGRVGIGTTATNPAYMLDVNGVINGLGFSGNGAQLSNIPGSAIVSTLSCNVIPSQLNANIGIGTGAKVDTILYAYGSNSSNITQIGVESPGKSVMYVGASNNLTILNSVSLTAPSASTSRTDLAIQTQGVERLRVSANNGYVGIGTSIPKSLLDVNGNVNAITISGNGSNITNLNASNITSGMVGTNYLPLATTTQLGIVTLNNTLVGSNMSNVAATANTVYLANSNANTRLSTSGGIITSNLIVASNLTAAKFIGDGSRITNISASNIINLYDALKVGRASTTEYGITLLVDSVNSQDTSNAATANSVYLANSNANTKLSLSGGTITGSITIASNVLAAAFIGDGSQITNISSSNVVGIFDTSNLPFATTTQYGITILVDDVYSGASNSNAAATANSVYLANSNADTRLSASGGTMTGDLTINATVTADYLKGDGSQITNIQSSNVIGVLTFDTLPIATTTQYGVTLLVDDVYSGASNSNAAATANSVYLANSNADTRVSKSGDTITGDLVVSSNLTAGYFIGDGSQITNIQSSNVAGVLTAETLPIATTSNYGITELLDSVESQSTEYAATANSVYMADQNANSRVSRSGDTMTGDLTVNATVYANYFNGDGSSIYNLSGSSIASGVVNQAYLPVASTTQSGIVQLSNDIASQATDMAATAYSVNSVYNDTISRVSRRGDTMTGDLTVNATVTANYLAGDGSQITNINANNIYGEIPVGNIPLASTTQVGIVQLEDSVTSTSTSNAATPNSVYLANSNADNRVRKSGDIMTGSLYIYGSNNGLTIYGGDVTANNLVARDTISAPNVAATTITGSIVNASIVSASGVAAGVVNTESILSPTGSLDMNYTRVLNVDSLVVRSNIQVTITGPNAYTNLPSDLVRLDPATGHILDAYISSNILRLMSDGTINPAMLPIERLPRSTMMRVMDNVGIGIRVAAQKLHLNNGNQCITGGRLGIGTSTTPLGALHVYDDNSGVPSVRIENLGSYDTLNIVGSNNIPLLFITANCNVGVHTAAPMYDLDVNGTIRGTTLRITNVQSDGSGDIDFGQTSLRNVHTVDISTLQTSNAIFSQRVRVGDLDSNALLTDALYVGGGDINTCCNYKVNGTVVIDGGSNIVNVNSVTSTGQITSQIMEATTMSTQYMYIGHSSNEGDPSQPGLFVNNSIVTQALLTISDRRTKINVVKSNSTADLNSVLAIPIHRYNFIGRKEEHKTVGFIAQEVEEVAPYAVKTISNPVPSILTYGQITSPNTIALTQGYESIEINSRIKLIYNNTEYIRTVVNIKSRHIHINDAFGMEVTLHLNDPLITQTSQTRIEDVFIYGHVVDDFKLIDTDRLMPLVFNSVKALNAKISAQSAVMETIMERLKKLERLTLTNMMM